MKQKTLVCCRYYPSCYCSSERNWLVNVSVVIVIGVAIATVVGLLAGCNPLADTPDRLDPSPSVMYTVIHPEE